MVQSNPVQDAKEFAAQTAADLRRCVPRALAEWTRLALADRAFMISAVVLFIVFQQVYFWTGKVLFLPNGALYGADAFLGWDSSRVVQDMIESGHNARSNVHPLFILYARPMAWVYFKLLNLSPHVSAIAVAAEVNALLVVLVMLLARLMGAAQREANLFAAIFGCATTAYYLGGVPETGSFSMLSILFGYVLLWLALRHGVRNHLVWLLLGLFTYGNAPTNFAKTCSAFLLAESWKQGIVRPIARVTVFGLIVVAVGVFLTLWVGSSLAWQNDLWIATPSERTYVASTDLPSEPEPDPVESRAGTMDGLATHMIRSFFLYTHVAPRPSFERVTFQSKDNEIVTNFNEGRFHSLARPLVLGWLVLLLAGLAALFARRDPCLLRFGALIAASLFFDFVLFSQYYVPFEGVFVWSPHYAVSVFMIALLAAPAISRLKPPMRLIVNLLLFAFIVGQFVNNHRVAREIVGLIAGG